MMSTQDFTITNIGKIKTNTIFHTIKATYCPHYLQYEKQYRKLDDILYITRK